MPLDIKKEWIKRDKKAIRKNYRFPSIVISKSEGPYLKGINGKQYIDFTSGGQTCNLGHNNTEVVSAVNAQVHQTGFCSHGWALNSTRIQLAEKLISLLKGKVEDPKVGYCSTGSDATELVMRLTREETGRELLMCHFGCYHGSISIGALAMNASSHTMSAPEIPGVIYQPFPYCYRCPLGHDSDDCDIACLDFIEYQFNTNVVPSNEVAAFFIEVVQVHGGVIPLPTEYLLRLERICKREGIKLVVDEVTTGFGRTGEMFAIDRYDVTADAIYMAKSIANGLPLGAILANNELMSHFSGGGTFSGNPISCAASIANIEVLQRENTLSHAQKMGEYLTKQLQDLQSSEPVIGDVRGQGLLIGVELVQQDNKPATKKTRQVINQLVRAGVLVFPAGAFQNVLRLCPPLIITETIVDDVVEKLEVALK